MKNLIFFYLFVLIISCKDNQKGYFRVYDLSINNNDTSNLDTSNYISEILFSTSEPEKDASQSDIRFFVNLETVPKSTDEFYFLLEGKKYELEYIREMQRFGENIELSFRKEKDRRSLLFLNITNTEKLLKKYNRLLENITFWHIKDTVTSRIPFLEKSKASLEVYASDNDKN